MAISAIVEGLECSLSRYLDQKRTVPLDPIAGGSTQSYQRGMTDDSPQQEPLFTLEFGEAAYKQVELNRLQNSIFPVVAKSGNKIRSIGT